MPGEAVLRTEPPDVGGLGHDLRGGEATDPGQAEEGGGEQGDHRHDPSLELVRRHRELPDPPHQIAGHPGHGPVEAVQASRGRIQGLETHQRARRRIPGGVQLVQVPAQAVDLRHTLPDQVFSVIDQEPQVPGRSVEPGDREIRLPERRPGHGEGVDRVGLAVGAGRVAGVGHELGRHPDQLLAGGEQVRLQAPGEVPAVLDGEPTDRTEPVGPPHELEVASVVVIAVVFSPSLRPASSMATAVCVRLCASIPTMTNSVYLSLERQRTDPVGGHTSVGVAPRSYQATPAGSVCPRGGKRHEVHEGHRA